LLFKKKLKKKKDFLKYFSKKLKIFFKTFIC